jgi:hypothetical protein
MQARLPLFVRIGGADAAIANPARRSKAENTMKKARLMAGLSSYPQH